MATLESALLIFAGVFLVETLLLNFIVKDKPYIPGDLYLDKSPLKLYIPIASAIVIAIILGIFLKIAH